MDISSKILLEMAENYLAVWGSNALKQPMAKQSNLGESCIAQLLTLNDPF